MLPILDPEEADSSGAASARCGVTLDINERGLLCASVGYLPVGGVVRLFIRLPTRPEEPIACNARVVRCEMSTVPAYGLKYIGIPLQDVRGPEFQRYARERRVRRAEPVLPLPPPTEFCAAARGALRDSPAAPLRSLTEDAPLEDDRVRRIPLVVATRS